MKWEGVHFGSGFFSAGPYFNFGDNRAKDAQNICRPYTICTTSAQRIRRRSNIVQMLYKCFVLLHSSVGNTWESESDYWVNNNHCEHNSVVFHIISSSRRFWWSTIPGYLLNLV